MAGPNLAEVERHHATQLPNHGMYGIVWSVFTVKASEQKCGGVWCEGDHREHRISRYLPIVGATQMPSG